MYVLDTLCSCRKYHIHSGSVGALEGSSDEKDKLLCTSGLLLRKYNRWRPLVALTLFVWRPRQYPMQSEVTCVCMCVCVFVPVDSAR